MQMSDDKYSSNQTAYNYEIRATPSSHGMQVSRVPVGYTYGETKPSQQNTSGSSSSSSGSKKK